MTSWYMVFTKVTDAIVEYGPTELQKNRMRAAAERHCEKPCLWLYYGPRMGNEQGSSDDFLYVSSDLGLIFLLSTSKLQRLGLLPVPSVESPKH